MQSTEKQNLRFDLLFFKEVFSRFFMYKTGQVLYGGERGEGQLVIPSI